MAQNGHLTSLLGSNIEAMRKSAIGLDGTSENKQIKIKTKHNGTNPLHDSNRDKKTQENLEYGREAEQFLKYQQLNDQLLKAS